MNSKMCIYHDNCMDGLMAAAVVGMANPGIVFCAAKYGEAPKLDRCRDRHVIIVDFSYSRADTLMICSVAKSVLIIDHHKTAKETLEGLEAPNLTIEFDMNRSGAGMAWDHYHDLDRRPRLVAMVEDRDLWKFQMEGSKELHYALSAEEMSPENFTALLECEIKMPKFVDGLLVKGAAMSRMFASQLQALEDQSFYAEVDDHIIRCANAPYIFASELAGRMAEGQPFAATFFFDGEQENWSLRSRGDGGDDVSAIAKKFGGGGHRNAAGFKVPRGTFRMCKSGFIAEMK